MPRRYIPERFEAEVQVGRPGCEHFSILCGKLLLTPKAGTIAALPDGEFGKPPISVIFPNTPTGSQKFELGSSLGCPENCAAAALAIRQTFIIMGMHEVTG